MTADEPRDSLRAHSVEVTTEWFLHHLRSTPAGRPDLLYADELFTESLCRELLSRSFVHRLRRAVSRDRANAEAIEALAASLLTAGPRGEVPGLDRYTWLACLLVSIGRGQLQACVSEQGINALEECALYRLGLRLYERGRSEGASEDEARYGLVAGVQLEKVKTKTLRDGDWYWDYVRFRRRRSVELEELRYRYLGLDPDDQNPVELFKQVRRYVYDCYADALWANGESVNALETNAQDALKASWSPNGKGQPLTLDVVDPLMFDFPVFTDVASTGSLLSEFMELVRSDEAEEENEPHLAVQENLQDFNLKCLTLPLRIVQWELQTRDIGKEQLQRKIFFSPLVELAGNQGIGFPPDKFLDALLSRSLDTHLRYLPAQDSFPSERPTTLILKQRAALMDRFQRSRRAFRRLVADLDKVMTESYPEAHKDYLLAVNERERESQHFTFEKFAVVEDGELSFYSLAWTLRTSRRGRTEGGLGNLEVELASGSDEEMDTPVARLLGCGESEDLVEGFIDWFHEDRFWDATLMELAEALGFVLALEDGKVLTTRRWRSFLDWLQRMVEAGRNGAHPSKPADWEPIKKLQWLEGDENWRFVEGMREVLRSESLRAYLPKALEAAYPDFIGAERFARDFLFPLVRILEPLCGDMEPGTTGMRDQVLFRASRTAFFPLEFLVRAYQPHESQLVICPVGIDASPALGEGKNAPISLGFATILGALPLAVKDVLSSTKGRVAADGEDSEGSKERREWAAPYWSIFAGFTSVLSVGERSRKSLETGVKEGMYQMLGALSHEAANATTNVFTNTFATFDSAFSLGCSRGAADLAALNQIDPRVSEVIGSWVFCPTPRALGAARNLLLLWAASKDSIEELELGEPERRRDFGQVLETIWRIAYQAAIMKTLGGGMAFYRDGRIQIEDIDVVETQASLSQYRGVGFDPTRSPLAPSNLKFASLAPAGGTSPREITDWEEAVKHMTAHLCRGLIAALANAFYHAKQDTDVVFFSRWLGQSGGMLQIEIFNAIDEDRSKSEYKRDTDYYFRFGTEAVGRYCFEFRLGGRFEMDEVDEALAQARGLNSGDRWYRCWMRLPALHRSIRWLQYEE